MDNRTRNIWLPLAILAAALIAWAALFAAGAYFEIGVDNPRHDIRKPLIILASMLTFLALWGLALWRRNHRKS
jgi:4-amino-4-deoxy-L-arabinose transferase-like glycosyltransferase